MTDIDRIIAGLSEAQRRALIEASDPNGEDTYYGSSEIYGKEHCAALTELGLTEGWPDRLSDLGLAVRNRLKEQDNA